MLVGGMTGNVHCACRVAQRPPDKQVGGKFTLAQSELEALGQQARQLLNCGRFGHQGGGDAGAGGKRAQK